MTDTLHRVKEHYRASGLTKRLEEALGAAAAKKPLLSYEQLASLDQFHTRGLAATEELADLAQISASTSVLDVGSGLGGPARFLAANYGCHVTGIELSEEFVDVARYLTELTHQTSQVRFRIGNGLALPFAQPSFDRALLQHVAMNIADRSLLYREIRRVLKPGGRFATFDVVLQSGEPHYPLPWARTPDTSFLLSSADTLAAIESAGFRVHVWRDGTQEAKAWFAQLQASGPPPSPNLGWAMGEDFVVLARNLGRSLMEGRLGIVMAVFDT